MRKIIFVKNIFSDSLKENGVVEKQIIIIELDDDKNASLRNRIELGKYIRKVTKK